MAIFSVFLGGGLGSISRYGIGLLFPYKAGFPWATFLSNLFAAFILGIILGWLGRQDPGSGTIIKLAIATGFCGGFSTFSTFSAETLEMIRFNNWNLAIIYVLCSLIMSVSLLALGTQIKF